MTRAIWNGAVLAESDRCRIIEDNYYEDNYYQEFLVTACEDPELPPVKYQNRFDRHCAVSSFFNKEKITQTGAFGRILFVIPMEAGTATREGLSARVPPRA